VNHVSVLTGENEGVYSIDEVLNTLRRLCLNRSIVPILCGASLRGIGVEPLLDSITAFLPSPLDRPKTTGTITTASIQQHGSKRDKHAKHKHRQKHALKHTTATAAAATAVVHDSSSSSASSEGLMSTVSVDPLSDQLVALAFKVTHDKRRMPIVVSSYIDSNQYLHC
jgi:translation elongation factor EF-G